jgi:hypothetical protein
MDGHAGGRQRHALLVHRARCQAQGQALLRHQLLGVGGVEHREAGVQAQGCGLVAQQPGGDAVEGAAPGQPRCLSAGRQAQSGVQSRACPVGEFGRRAAREAQQQQPVWIGPRHHQRGHPGGQHGGLAGAGTGHHEQRGAAVRDCGDLLGAELFDKAGGHPPTV